MKYLSRLMKQIKQSVRKFLRLFRPLSCKSIQSCLINQERERNKIITVIGLPPRKIVLKILMRSRFENNDFAIIIYCFYEICLFVHSRHGWRFSITSVKYSGFCIGIKIISDSDTLCNVGCPCLILSPML